MRLLLTCPRELPPFLAREVEALGLPVLSILPAGVETEGDLTDCLRLNLHVRTAHRVLLRLGAWQARTADEMYEAVHGVPWEQWIPADGYMSVVSSVSTGSIDNVMYANMRCKDAVVDRIRAKKGRRPDSGPDTSQTVVFLYWHNTDLMVYIDTSGTPLSERGYRVHPAKAPMRETLAAAVVMSTKWDHDAPFINPMCGSGTLGIEAEMLARNIAPGSIRDNFGFMHVLPYDPRVWQRLKNEAVKAADMSRTVTVLCSDHDHRVIRQARDNARRAGVKARFDVADFHDVRPPATTWQPREEGKGPVIILNPEFGIRLGNEAALAITYSEIGDLFKQEFKGYTGYVFTGNFTLAKKVGLRSSRRMTFWSADLECRLLEYEMYEGSRK